MNLFSFKSKKKSQSKSSTGPPKLVKKRSHPFKSDSSNPKHTQQQHNHSDHVDVDVGATATAAGFSEAEELDLLSQSLVQLDLEQTSKQQSLGMFKSKANASRMGDGGDTSSNSSESEEDVVEDGLTDSVFDDPVVVTKARKPADGAETADSMFEVLCKVPFFAQFKHEHRQQLFDELKPVSFQDGEKIVHQDAVGDRFFVIVHGEAVVSKVLPDGSEVDITHIYKGDYFGELSLIYGQRRVANVTSVGVTKCLYLSKTSFEQFEEIRLFLILSKVPLLSDLNKDNQLAILRKLKPVNFEPGQYVVKQGDRGDAFYMITKGSAVVIEGGEYARSYGNMIVEPGPEKIITHLYEGHSFGEMALLTEEARIASVRAEELLTCMCLEAKDFQELLGEGEFAILLAKENDKIVNLRQKRTRQRQFRKSTMSPHHMSNKGSHSSMVREQRKLNAQISKSGEKIINGFVIMEEIGKGTFGVVHLCRQQSTKELFALKTIDKSRFQVKTGVRSRHAGDLEDMQREVAIMKKLAHPNVVNLVEVVDDPNADQLYLIMEYCAKGAIMTDLKATPFSEVEARKYFRMLLMGLDYLHSQNVIHRDIKPMNLLLNEEDVLKITDFGAARVLMGHGDQLVGVAGSPAFMAPELLSMDTALYSGPAVDLWSCGATLFMMVIGEPPWMSDEEITLANRVKKDELVFPQHPKLDPHLKSLIKNLLVKDASRRFDLEATMNHSWVTEEGIYDLPRYENTLSRKDSNLRLSLTKEDRQEAISLLRMDTYGSMITATPPRPSSRKGAPSTDSGKDPNTRSPEEIANDLDDLGENVCTVDDVDLLSEDDAGSVGEEIPESVGQTMRRGHAISDHTLDIGRAYKPGSSFLVRKMQEEMREQQKHKSDGAATDSNFLGAEFVEVDEDDSGDESVSNAGGKKRRPSSAPFLPLNSTGLGSPTTKLLRGNTDTSLQALPSNVGPLHAKKGIPIMWAKLMVGVAENQGIRVNMEDTTMMVPKLKGNTFFAGVYDGHGGDYVSLNLQNTLHQAIGERKLFHTDLERSIRQGCHMVDRRLLYRSATAVLEHQKQVDSGQSRRGLLRTKGETKNFDNPNKHELALRSGSTAVFAFVRVKQDQSREVTVGWVGDSRAVLCRDGQGMPLSVDHKASREDETQRIRACSGTVDRRGRLYGDLAVSRAFGNLQHKGRDLKKLVEDGEASSTSDDESQDQGPLIATPDTLQMTITPGDEFVILASDGVWDVLTNQQVVNFVRREVYQHGDVQAAATNLMEKAYNFGSVDNMSCVIIMFM